MTDQNPVPLPPTAPVEPTPSEIHEPSGGSRRRHGLFFPLLLIAVGAVLFLSNAGMISGDMGQLLLNLWPLIFVVGGLDGLYKGEGAIGPLVFIALGLALILGNFGYFPGNSWEVLLRLWPIFLVAIGLDLLFRGRALWLTLARVALGLLLAAGILWLAWTTPGARGQNVMDVSQPLYRVSAAEVILTQASGRLELSGGTPADMLAVGKLEYTGNAGPLTTFNQANTKGYYKVDGARNINVTFNAPTNTWALALTKEVPLTITSRLAVGDQNLNLSGLKVSDLSSELAVGKIAVTLPAGQKVNARLSVAVGSIVVSLPKGSKVRLNTSAGLGTVDLPPGLEQNASLDTADYVLDLSTAIGSVSIKYLP